MKRRYVHFSYRFDTTRHQKKPCAFQQFRFRLKCEFSEVFRKEFFYSFEISQMQPIDVCHCPLDQKEENLPCSLCCVLCHKNCQSGKKEKKIGV